MSKLIYVCYRDHTPSKDDVERLKCICKKLDPDNINAAEPVVQEQGKTLFGISNPNTTLEIRGNSILMGKVFVGAADWKELNSDELDGNFAIFRADDSGFEIVSDILATRTVWYYHDEKVFIASTSQLALVDYLGDYQFNPDVIPWVLANGLLGPELSWDKRINQLQPDSRIKLDFSTWKKNIVSNPVRFQQNSKTESENIDFLRNILEESYSSLNLDYSKWTLTLSGGYDSRGNLLFLPKKDKKGVRLHSVTWGLKESQDEKGNDAAIAAELAKKFNLNHQYFPTDPGKEPIEVVVERFLRNGEGRIDHLGGYMDGFKVWKTLYDNEKTGVIRGDEVFGSYYFISTFHMKHFMGLSLCKEYDNLKKYDYIQSLKQDYPEKFKRREKESFEQWRDRLYQTYLVPVFLGALADLKQGYVEQLNPLLGRKIINAVRELPEHLRTQKKAFKKIVNSFDVGVGYAKGGATKSISNIFKEKEVVGLVTAKLKEEASTAIFPKEFLEKLVQHINKKKRKAGVREKAINYIKSLIPKKMKKMILKRNFTPKLDEHVLAFRVFLILRMKGIFEERAKS